MLVGKVLALGRLTSVTTPVYPFPAYADVTGQSPRGNLRMHGETTGLVVMWRCYCRYCFTTWAIQLNEITPGLEKKLAPTDCRLRPDQHYTELGEYDKVRLAASLMLWMLFHRSSTGRSERL